MRRNKRSSVSVIWSCVFFATVGCGTNLPPSVLAPTGGTSSSGTTPKTTCSGGAKTQIDEPSIYLVQAGHEPYSVLVFPQKASGATTPTAEIPGTLVSLDGMGDIYVLAPSGSCIVEYPAASSGDMAGRFLPVGPGTKISAVTDMAVSTTGDIFVSDGKGIAVFSPTATSDADPVRYIVPAGITPNVIAVDSMDNLYVQDFADASIAVFGPTATGTATPSRRITGPLSYLSGVGAHVALGMATDSSGNLYALCVCTLTGGNNGNVFGVFKFGPQADGNVAPMKVITSADMYPWSGGPGIAVDPMGVIYVTAGPPIGGTQTVFEFPADSSGSVSPFNTVTSPTVWTDTPVSKIAVH
jgi:hypothetical protein